MGNYAFLGFCVCVSPEAVRSFVKGFRTGKIKMRGFGVKGFTGWFKPLL